MRLIHTSDWHLGRKLEGFSLWEEQNAFLEWLLEEILRQRADALLVAGDIYDRAVPPPEAVELFDRFLCCLRRETGVPAFLIAGNHDSPTRLGFGREFLRDGGVHLLSRPAPDWEPVVLRDRFGDVYFWPLPWLEPAVARQILGQDDLRGFHAAAAAYLERRPPAPGARNVLLAHGFFANVGRAGELLRCDSELAVGGAELIDSSLCAGYTYTALGHLHSAQNAGADGVRYSGSPLVYSVSEAGGQKSVELVELDARGVTRSETLPVPPLRQVRRLRGSLEEILDWGRADPRHREDYLFAVLTEEAPLADAAARLRALFPRFLGLRALARETSGAVALAAAAGVSRPEPAELFSRFYEALREEPLAGRRREIVEETADTLKKEERAR